MESLDHQFKILSSKIRPLVVVHGFVYRSLLNAECGVRLGQRLFAAIASRFFASWLPDWAALVAFTKKYLHPGEHGRQEPHVEPELEFIWEESERVIEDAIALGKQAKP